MPSQPPGQVGHGGLRAWPEAAGGHLRRPSRCGRRTTRATGQGVPPIFRPLRHDARQLRHLVAPRGRVVAGQGRPALGTHLWLDLDDAVHLLHRQQRSSVPRVADLPARGTP